MKIKLPVTQTRDVNVKFVEINIPIDRDDRCEDLPLLDKAKRRWKVRVDIDTGQIQDWPGGAYDLEVKVVDSGTYRLISDTGEEIGLIEQDYVPNGVVPGEFGDYVHLVINDQGIVTNWRRGQIDLSAFLKDYDEE